MTTDLEAPVDEQLVRDLLADLLRQYPPTRTPLRIFLEAQFDAGLAWVHFSKDGGGLGVSPDLQKVVEAGLTAAGAPGPAPNGIGSGMAAPTIAAHGTHEQRKRFLRPLFTGEQFWCQLFSEPGAGSDLASLSTRAQQDGDEWIVNGQKVWNTFAHLADMGILVARTDPEAPKHKGLTYFLVDMHSPGIEVKPLRQMTGEAEFNEVFFNDARIADVNRLGAVGDGWRVALTTLMNERVTIGGSVSSSVFGSIQDVLRVWRAKKVDDLVQQDKVVQVWIESEVNRLTNLRSSQARRAGGTAGPEGSVGKLAFAILNKRMAELVMELLGPEAMLYPSGYDMTAERSRGLQQIFLRTRANSVEGGSSEIMRNILGERVLGLPGDVRVDKELPWARVPRN